MNLIYLPIAYFNCENSVTRFNFDTKNKMPKGKWNLLLSKQHKDIEETSS